MIKFNDVSVGEQLPILTTKPISRTTLALFAGASGDHNPIHIDSDFAKSAGLTDVIAHGMLSMAYLGRLLTGWVPQTAINRIDVRFTAITQIFAQITCTGTVEEKIIRDDKQIIMLRVEAKDEHNEVKVSGIAEIQID
jgi:acyl dehydratase